MIVEFFYGKKSLKEKIKAPGCSAFGQRQQEFLGFPGASMVKNLPANSGAAGDKVSIPESRRSPGGRHGNTLQYSCLENSMNRGAWQAMVHGVAKNQTQLSN